jgi:hypothetical protein
MATIDAFKTNALRNGGARANLFEVELTGGIGDGRLFSFMCKGAQLPGSVIAQIDVPYRGRQLKVAGDRTFENWTVTVFNDNENKLRGEFEEWMNSINAHESNTGILSPSAYYAQLKVTQLDRQNRPTKAYKIVDAFPVNIGAIDLSYDANDAIEEFTVEFAYQYWTTGKGGSDTGITT